MERWISDVPAAMVNPAEVTYVREKRPRSRAYLEPSRSAPCSPMTCSPVPASRCPSSEWYTFAADDS